MVLTFLIAKANDDARPSHHTATINKIKNLECTYTNADVLSNKVDELKTKLHLSKSDLGMITECLPKVKLRPLKESDIAIQGYQIFSNIDETSNRGVALYLSDKFRAKRLDYSTTDSSLECLFVEIKVNEKDNLVCGVVYRSPSKDNLESLRRLISDIISDRQHDQILIIGDFNYPDINWENHLSNTDEEHPVSRFLKLTDDCFLTQHVNKSTRHRHTKLRIAWI